MPYPYTWTDPAGNPVNSYANVDTVQEYFASYTISEGEQDHIGVQSAQDFLAEATAQIDAVLLKAGLLVPPPAGAAILPILKQTAAVGAAAAIEHARYEGGDDAIGKHANGLRNAFDAQLGILERQDINCVLMGMVSAGWSPQANVTAYFKSGNLEPDSYGNPKQPQFTMGMEF